MWPPFWCRLTCHGQLPGCASEPPTILVEDSGRPQSAVGYREGHIPSLSLTAEAQVTQDKALSPTRLFARPLPQTKNKVDLPTSKFLVISTSLIA